MPREITITNNSGHATNGLLIRQHGEKDVRINPNESADITLQGDKEALTFGFFHNGKSN